MVNYTLGQVGKLNTIEGADVASCCLLVQRPSCYAQSILESLNQVLKPMLRPLVTTDYHGTPLSPRRGWSSDVFKSNSYVHGIVCWGVNLLLNFLLPLSYV